MLRAHLPDAVSKRIEAGLVEFVSEIRVCTILFIGFPSLKVSLYALLTFAVHTVQLCAQCSSKPLGGQACRQTGNVLPTEVV